MQNWTTVVTPDSKSAGGSFLAIWSYRHLIELLVKRDLRTSYTQTFGGAAWLLLQPLMSSLIYVFVFSVIARIPIEGVPPFLYIFSGVALWLFFTDCATTSANTFVVNGALFSKAAFPRLCMPIASSITAFFNFLFRLIPLFLYLVYAMIWEGVSPHFGWIPLLLPTLVAVVALGMGLGLLVAALATRYRDLLLALGPILQFGMFASPVLYQLTMVPEPLGSIMSYNPMAVLIGAFRFVIIGMGEMHWLLYLACFVFSIGLFAFGASLFSKAEKSVMDQI